MQPPPVPGVLLTVRDSTGCVLFPNATTAAIPVGSGAPLTSNHSPFGLVMAGTSGQVWQA